MAIVSMTGLSLRAQVGHNNHELAQSKVANGSSSEANLFLNLSTDCWPEETSWELTDLEGNVVHEGGPYYGQALSDITEELCLESGNFTFHFFDAAGDGLYATQWGSLCDENGSFELIDAGGNVLLADTGGMNFDTLSISFEFNATVSVAEQEIFSEVILYPNPVSDMLYGSLELTGNRPVEITLVSPSGQIIWNQSYGNLVTGKNLISISMAELPVGIYTLGLFSDKNVVYRRISKVH